MTSTLAPAAPARPSSRWALLRTFEIRGTDGDLYLWRLRVLETPWFTIKLHWIRRRDHDRDLHDHPWPFVSLVLWGSYRELVALDARGAITTTRRVRWFNRKRAPDPHRIVEVSRGGAWTLVFTGPRVREWGFHTPTGWTPWHEYLGVQP